MLHVSQNTKTELAYTIPEMVVLTIVVLSRIGFETGVKEAKDRSFQRGPNVVSNQSLNI